MIIRSSGGCRARGRRSTEAWEAHRHGEQKKEEHRTSPAPGGRGYGMARQCPHDHSSCKAREDAGVTPTSTTSSTAPETTAQALRAAPALGQSRRRAHVDGEDASSPELVNRQRRFSTRSREEAICQRRKQSKEPRRQIDRSSRGGSDQVGGEVRGARRRPEHGGGHGGDAIATRVARRVRVRSSERDERVSE
jgi:hypothetical protein